MQKMKVRLATLILAIFIFMLSPLNSFAQGSAPNSAELLMFEADNCPYCENWKREIGVIYHKTPEGKIAPLRIININDNIAKEYSLKSKIFYSPTFVLINKGKEKGRIEGYAGEDFFWYQLETLLKELK